ncbi:uncharacterized protein VTP21DRAFT_4148 [Calcarisporiella thermophila]|uniref:uncharacterized protein n=1 Tax=Calcarisporiella thermophila TaxID=911321 RepID=UPI003743B406
MGNAQSTTQPYVKLDAAKLDRSVLSDYIDLANESLGASILACSNEHFSAAENLIKASSPEKLEKSKGKNIARYDAWETRRHNDKPFDWVIIKLGFSGTIAGFDIDTSLIDGGNHAQRASIEACFSPSNNEADFEWKTILPEVKLRGDAHHLYALPDTPDDVYTHIRLKIYPDGAISRLHIYGTVEPSPSKFETTKLVDLASVGHGGRAVSCSDQYFGRISNLLLPMPSSSNPSIPTSNSYLGWETQRSRTLGHRDWVVIKLGAAGRLEKIELDTTHFDGSAPEFVQVEACNTPEHNPDLDVDVDWTIILPRIKVERGSKQTLLLSKSDDIYSHVRLTIYPDGGIRRVRVLGRVVTEEVEQKEEEGERTVPDSGVVQPGTPTTSPIAPTSTSPFATIASFTSTIFTRETPALSLSTKRTRQTATAEAAETVETVESQVVEESRLNAPIFTPVPTTPKRSTRQRTRSTVGRKKRRDEDEEGEEVERERRGDESTHGSKRRRQ